MLERFEFEGWIGDAAGIPMPAAILCEWLGEPILGLDAHPEFAVEIFPGMREEVRWSAAFEFVAQPQLAAYIQT